MPWKLKTDDKGSVVFKDSEPVYLRDDGSEFVANAERMYGKISQLTTEAKQHRERAEAAEGKLKAFAGVGVDDLKRRAETADETTRQLHQSMIESAFGMSPFVRDKIAVPANLFRKEFADKFKVTDGKLVAVDDAGEPLLSMARPGTVAEFNEAIELLANRHPDKDSMLKGANATGSGSKGGGNSAIRTITRAGFEAMSPRDQANAMASVRMGRINFTD